MKRMGYVMTLLAAAAGVWTGAAMAQATQAELDAITAYKFGESREPLTVVADKVRASLADLGAKAKMAAQLAAILPTDATLDCKQFVCRQLMVVGTAAEVPVLAAMLADADTADMARYALERMPFAEVDDALLAALPKTEGTVKAGIVNSLGARGCAKAVDALAELTACADALVAASAIGALGRIGTKAAAEALEEVEGARAVLAADALLLCADALCAAGETNEARGIYDELYDDNYPRRVRVAAFQGLVLSKGEKGTKLVIEELTGDDGVLQGVAATMVRELPGASATKAFAKQLDKLAPDGQVLLISALADRDDSAALSAVIDVLDSNDEAVRIAALEALAVLGDEGVVMLLAGFAAASKGVERDVARAALSAVRGEAVDAAIVDAFSSDAPPAVVVELIEAAVARNLKNAVPGLMRVVESNHVGIREAAFEALGALAAPADLGGLVQALLNLKGEEERNEAEKAVVSVARRAESGQARVEPLLAALYAAPNVEARCSLIKALGEIGDDAALERLQAEASCDDEAVRDAAVRALSGWPNATEMPHLLAIAKETKNPTHRILALRGYTRLLALPSGRPMEQTLNQYNHALAMCERPEELKAVLASLSNVNDPGALALCEQYLNDEAVQAEAIAATLKLAKALSGGYRKAAEVAVGKVLAVTGDAGVKQRAEEVLAFIERFDDFVVAWHVSPRYAQEGKNGKELFDIALPPEDPDANVAWDVMPLSENPDQIWKMDLDRKYGGDNCAAYLKTVLHSDKAQDAQFWVGSDDGVKIWLNGEVVHANNTVRGCAPDQDKVNVSLKKGANPVLVKVADSSGDWALAFRVRDAGGGPIEGVDAALK